jgi:hypothetical protein
VKNENVCSISPIIRELLVVVPELVVKEKLGSVDREF